MRQVNQFRALARDLRSCQTSWQGAGDDGFSLFAVQTDVPATQGGRGETKNVRKDKAWMPDLCGHALLGVDAASGRFPVPDSVGQFAIASYFFATFRVDE